MKIFSYFNILCFVSLLSACGNSEKSSPEKGETKSSNSLTLTTQQISNTKISIGKATFQNINSHLSVNGLVDVPPQNMVSISFPLGGYLKKTSLLPGTHVRKGELIAIIEDQQIVDLQKDYLSAQNKITYLQKEAERQKILSAEQASSQKEAQLTQMELQTEQINKQSLAEKLKMMGLDPSHLTISNISKTISLKSPIDGFVTKINVNIGKYFNPSEVLFELVNPSDIHLNLKVFQQDAQKLKIGQKVSCYLPSEPNKKYDAEIILISKDVNANNTIEVHCHFHRFPENLIPGMFLNAQIETDASYSWTLPDLAIVNFENNSYVFKALSKQSFKLVPVQIGVSEQGKTIVNGLDSSANYVLNDAYTLLLQLKKEDTE